jgi:beta-glucosidase
MGSEERLKQLDARVAELLARMTLEEKIACMPPFLPPNERLGLPGIGMGGEGAHGLVLRGGEESTVFPQPFGLSMTWDRDLMKRIGGAIGDEARVWYNTHERKGMLCLFFPTIDMERDPRWGRNEEAYGEDPLLAGTLAAELIKGAQGEDAYFLKIVTTPKHFYANNYEYERASADSVIADERLKYEYYLRVFAYAFEEGGAMSLMTAYNKINGIPGMLHPEMNEIVRGKWGAQGFFVSDGGAFKLVQTEHKAYETYAESAAAAIKAGLDSFLDNPDLTKDSVREALEKGFLTEAELEKAAANKLRVLFRLGVYGGDTDNPYDQIPDGAMCSEAHAALAREASRKAVTLLENDGFLPLCPAKTKKIAVLGQLGNENVSDWYSGNPPYKVTPLDGVKKAFPDSEVVFENGCDLAAFFSETDGKWLRVAEDGAVCLDADEGARTVFKVWEWGYGGFGFQNTATGLYLTTTPTGELRGDAPAFWGWFVRELFFMENGAFMPEKAHGTSAEAQIGVAMRRGVNVYDKPYEEGGADRLNAVLSRLSLKVLRDGLAAAAEAASGADAAVVLLGNHTLVGARECIDRETLEIPRRFAALFDSAAAANPNTVLFIIAGYPYDIEAMAKKARAVVFTTHGMQEVGTAVGETLSGANNPAGRLSMTWYRAGDALPDLNDYDIVKNKMTYLYCDRPVLYPFGYGRSYTTFGYDDLEVKKREDGVVVTFFVTNTGQASGDEVAQVYFTHVDAPVTRPIKQLAGFERITLEPGETRRVSILVPKKELAIYDAGSGAFREIGGEYRFMAGAGSADVRLTGSVTL